VDQRLRQAHVDAGGPGLRLRGEELEGSKVEVGEVLVEASASSAVVIVGTESGFIAGDLLCAYMSRALIGPVLAAEAEGGPCVRWGAIDTTQAFL
jgi:hypothetical protein